MKMAGTREAFRRVDYGLARRHGAPTFVLNSAMGADPDSRLFYNRVKGKLERDLKEVGFDSLTFVRPGLIGGEREELRLGERLATAVLGTIGPVWAVPAHGVPYRRRKGVDTRDRFPLPSPHARLARTAAPGYRRKHACPLRLAAIGSGRRSRMERGGIGGSRTVTPLSGPVLRRIR